MNGKVKIGRRSKVVIYTTIWAVAGIALLAIPLLVSTNVHYPAPSTGPTGDTGSTNIFTITPTTVDSTTKLSSPSTSGAGLGDFLFRLSLVLVPAVVLSSLMMMQVRRGFRRHLQPSSDYRRS